MRIHETLDRESAPPPPEQWRKVGNSALAYFGEAPTPTNPAEPEGFDHLFPFNQLSADIILDNTKNAEDAIELARTLDSDDPYRDYALSQLSLHYLQQGDLPHAYELIGDITEPGAAVHMLSKLVIFEDDNQTGTLELDQIEQQLHDLAIEAYDEAPTTERARAICEASEALPADKDLRLFARVAMAEHPEILPPQEPDDML